MANDGYTTVLEGILGPWHFEPLREELADCRAPAHHAVFRPDSDTCLLRAQERVLEAAKHRDTLPDEDPIRHMWKEFSYLGPLEHFVIDSSALDPQGTAMHLRERVAVGDLVFPAVDP
ncbi:MAG: hypothetical protein ACRDYE_02900 [Acidimicrobiales bacterium]